ncbi:MAG TPA: VWA domain-containing protein, partial [Thermoanaerobaculia bacterium]
MIRLPRISAFACSLSFALGAAGGAAAQQAAEPPAAPAPAADEQADDQSVFFDRVDVDVVNVDVYVTDRRGEPVTGLTAGDFEVFEDGRPMEITNFYAVADGRPAVAEAPAESVGETASQAAADGAAAPAERFEPPEDQRLHLVVYVDNLNIRPENRAWVFEAVRRFVYQHVRAEDRVMLVTYDRSLHVRQPFTSDPELVVAALEAAGKLTAGSAARDMEWRQALRDIERTANLGQAEAIARSFAQNLYHETETTIAAAKSMVNMLAGVVGRKALLYVSDGLPLVAGEDLYVAVQERHSTVGSRLRSRQFDLASRYRELAAQANGGEVTLYMLEARGLEVASSVSAESMGSTLPHGRFAIEAARDANLEAPLLELAEATGGQAILNTNAVDRMLDRVARDFRTYYSIGYRAAHARDGRYHQIEVRPKRPGLTVRHREGYRGKSSEIAMIDTTLAALHFDFGSNPLGARLELGSPRRDSDRLFAVTVTVRVPIGALTLVPHGEVHRGRVRLWLGVIDDEGGVSPVLEQQPLELAVPDAEIEQAMASFYTYQ